MDVRFFLTQRIAFIRQLYAVASAPYVERKQKIETGEDPFMSPYSEDGEPPFLEEWLEADESLHVLAYSCISMLAASLHLYLKAWERESGHPVDESLKKSEFKKNGWLRGYIVHFSSRLSIDFDVVPANLQMLSEVVLARNRIEHPASIISRRAQYADADLEKIHHPFFVDEREAVLLADSDECEKSWLMPPTLHVTAEKLLVALAEAERFVEWFEVEIEKRLYPR
ncbi:hypothetical protein [Rhodoferax sp.]|uniref:hypothetical protein n=1 Tax=Rhodoferax sp. TaxID=50421 RepID=UPI0037834B0C